MSDMSVVYKISFTKYDLVSFVSLEPIAKITYTAAVSRSTVKVRARRLADDERTITVFVFVIHVTSRMRYSHKSGDMFYYT